LQYLIAHLLQSPEPAIRWKIRANILDEDITSPGMLALQEEVRRSATVQKLISGLANSLCNTGGGVYAKWQGIHWILATLADIGYPVGDEALIPAKKALLDFWLSDQFYQEFEAETKHRAYQKTGVPVMQGRYRRCAAQQGNALYMLLKLGLHDKRLNDLVERLLHWQWPDGGWNCDKNPDAHHSSFMETLLPLRGLALYAKTTDNANAANAAAHAADVFLKRNLYKKQRNGEVIDPEFIALHYPLYWHYDILGGLKVLAEAGFINDPRCKDALDLLQSKQLSDDGWPAERSYYKVSDKITLGADYVNWGGTSKSKMNEWVTADALFVLNKAGRI